MEAKSQSKLHICGVPSRLPAARWLRFSRPRCRHKWRCSHTSCSGRMRRSAWRGSYGERIRRTPRRAMTGVTLRVDVVIPAFNEADTIVLCLAALLRQTVRPYRVILVDDGSTDGTLHSAEVFCRQNGLELIAIQRAKPIGKTPTIKRQAREFDSDVEFILDGDTILESPNYIERVVRELYQGVGIASACGTVLPCAGAIDARCRTPRPSRRSPQPRELRSR